MMSNSREPKSEELIASEETHRRFEAALRGAFATSPKRMKDIPRRRSK